MEIATTISSPSQMPQTMAEITPANGAGGPQVITAQSPCFGLLFDHWAGKAGGERVPADPGNNKFPQSRLQGESPAETATDGAQSNDPSHGPLLRATDSFPAGLFTIAFAATDKTVLQQSEQTAADAGTSGHGKGINSAPEQLSGKTSVPETLTLQMLVGMQQKIGKTGNTGEDMPGGMRSEGARKAQTPSENPAVLDTPGGLPIMAAEEIHSADFPTTEKKGEANAEKEGMDSVWVPLFAVGNLLNAGNSATSLSASAASIRQQGNVPAENNAGQSGVQQGDFLRAVQETGGLIPTKTSDTVPVFEAPSQPSFLKGVELFDDTSQGIGLPAGNPGKVSESTMKTGGNGDIPDVKEKIQASRDVLLSRTKVISSETIDISSSGANESSQKASPTAGVQSRMNSESAGNAYRTAAAETVLQGKNDLTSLPGNIMQGKPPANQEQSAAGTGMDLSRMEIVFATEARENLKEPGGPVARKSGEGITADTASTLGLVTNREELQTTGESRITTPSPEAKNPLGEHITNQVREKLAAGGLDSDNGQITLKLHPDELGELKINMRMEDQHLKVEITTQNPTVKEALMQNLDTLKETLSRQNIAMDRFDVSADIRQGSQQGGGDGRQMAQDSRLINAGFRHDAAIEDEGTPNLQYSWQNEDSLVNLVL